MNPSEFYWTESNISGILTEKLTNFLKDENFTIQNIDIKGTLYTRRQTKKISYFITIIAKNQSTTISLKEFDTLSTENDISCTDTNLKSLFYNFIKKLEKEIQNYFLVEKNVSTKKPKLLFNLKCEKFQFISLLKLKSSFIKSVEESGNEIVCKVNDDLLVFKVVFENVLKVSAFYENESLTNEILEFLRNLRSEFNLEYFIE